jgi:hypothetical protein
VPRRLQLDSWSPLSYKGALGGPDLPSTSKYAMPVWTGEHARRLQAYQILQAYLDNAAREFLPDTPKDHREYGDPALLRDTIMDSVLGDEQQINVDGAGSYDPEGDDDPEATAAWELQEWLRQAWADEHGPLKMVEAERDAVGLGDAVYSIGWSTDKNRARIRVWDPGFYFPVVEDGNDDDFPNRVHIAWEVQDDRPGVNGPRVKVRRLTWELVELPPGETRTYAWSDQPSTKTCLYTDATWQIDTARREVDDLQAGAAVYAVDPGGIELNQVDLEMDFIPVVHITNSVALKDGFGRSSLMLVTQILDDIARGDTQLAAAAETVANPTPVLKKATLGGKQPAWNPGETWEVGDGDLTLLDTSRSLEALTGRLGYLQDKLERNARTPAALLGRVKPSEFPSGIALQMTFGPLGRMVARMRLARNPKYRVLLRFLWRVNLANGASDVPASWFEAEMVFGSFMPADRAAVVQHVTQLRGTTPPTISLETAIDMLAAAGIEIDETTEEILQIQARDFAGALALYDATSDIGLVSEYLQVTIEQPPAPEPPNPDPDPYPAEDPGGPPPAA